nr:lipopolysaccharide transport periplasmic protein LptA [uncultured Celeribacter sp.]
MLRTISLATVFSLSLMAVSGPALSQGTNIAFGNFRQDSSLPVEITSDQLSVDQTSGQATFNGNVLIAQGEMRLGAEGVDVIYSDDGDKISKLLATGDVIVTNAGETAEAQNAEYDLESGTITLSGRVLLTQGQSALSGERMVIDLATGTGRMDGRVKTILQPGNN